MSAALIDEMRATGAVVDLRRGAPGDLEARLAYPEFGFIVGSSHDQVERAYEWVERGLAAAGLSGETAEKMGIACREAINNAQRHGNRWQEERRIVVHLLRDARKVIVCVADEGQGFDFPGYARTHLSRDALAAARERHRQGGLGGLGLKMMLECCDRVLCDHAGGTYLVKYLAPPTAGELERYDRLQPASGGVGGW